MFCISCCASAEEATTGYNTIAVDERDPGLESVPAQYDPGKQKEKIGEPEEPEIGLPPVTCYWITIQRKSPKVPLGLTLDPAGIEAIYVCSVQSDSAPVVEANAQNSPAEQLEAGDFVWSVNGVQDDLAAMMKEVQRSTTLNLGMRKPLEFSISVKRNGQSIGCAITYDTTTGISLVIEHVNEGPVKAWNTLHHDRKVIVGDRVTAVNGHHGTSVQLLEQIRASDDLRLTLVRPAKGTFLMT